ncbi:MAG: amidase [Saprospiraceae bacterium]|nr:amidase [Saprospiraceae bacterium]
MKRFFSLVILFAFISCKQTPPIDIPNWEPYDQSGELAANQDHEKSRMHFKLIQSKYLDKNVLWQKIAPQIQDFSESDYAELKPYILEKDILSIQKHIDEKKLTYKTLTQWYLYRILKYENTRDSALHTIIDINADAVKIARDLDKNRDKDKHPIYGMPILLKDNIGAEGMATTAGSQVLANNMADDAFIVKQLKSNGAIILGKANLSEWAYYFCSGCPLGYSSMGGQTLNPYGRKEFETGGSSSGSGVATAANYAVAAVGTETSGSILSPSSQNSVVGLKPTIGLLSRNGIVPISSTLDTPGPMTKNVSDNAILLSAMSGIDKSDEASENVPDVKIEMNFVSDLSLKGKKLGAYKYLMEGDSIYNLTIDKVKSLGAEIVELERPDIGLDGFLTLLNIDMKHDLPKYMETQASDNIIVRTIEDVIKYNLEDTIKRMPYGQALFEGIAADSTTIEELEDVKSSLNANGVQYFSSIDSLNLDAVLSINNYHAGFAAVAKYPCLTVPMGYKESGEPISLTFIAKPFKENELLKLGFAFEKGSKVRKGPGLYGK